MKNREIQLQREFNAPRERVFEAWTKPEYIGQWWGPNGFTTTTKSMSFKKGGEWIFIMHGPDGTDYQNHIVYTDIKKPEYLKYDNYGHKNKEAGPPLFRSEIRFEDIGKKTKIRMTVLFPDAAARNKAAEYAIEGGKQTLGRLADFLQENLPELSF